MSGPSTFVPVILNRSGSCDYSVHGISTVRFISRAIGGTASYGTDELFRGVDLDFLEFRLNVGRRFVAYVYDIRQSRLIESFPMRVSQVATRGRSPSVCAP